MKKHKLRLESDLKREQMYLKFKEEELQKNREDELELAARAREHEVRMADIYHRAMSANTIIKEITFSPHLQLTCTQ